MLLIGVLPAVRVVHKLDKMFLASLNVLPVDCADFIRFLKVASIFAPNLVSSKVSKAPLAKPIAPLKSLNSSTHFLTHKTICAPLYKVNIVVRAVHTREPAFLFSAKAFVTSASKPTRLPNKPKILPKTLPNVGAISSANHLRIGLTKLSLIDVPKSMIALANLMSCSNKTFPPLSQIPLNNLEIPSKAIARSSKREKNNELTDSTLSGNRFKTMPKASSTIEPKLENPL